MSETRTDIHRPGSPDFDPEAYTLLGVFDLNPEFGDGRDRIRTVNAALDRGSSFAGSPHGSRQCGHCGHWPLRYAALLEHQPTKTLLWVGETCLDGRFELSKAEFRALREAAALNRERMAKADRIAQLVDDCPPLAWLTYPDCDTIADNDFLADVAARFRRDGRLSNPQIEAVVKAIIRDTERREARAARDARAAELAAAGVTAPEGKVTVEGEIVSTKLKDGYMGGVTAKMTVRADAGWAVWVTVPSALTPVTKADMYDELVGARVRFTATLTRSDRDPLFAFGTRPTKATITTPAPAAAEREDTYA